MSPFNWRFCYIEEELVNEVEYGPFLPIPVESAGVLSRCLSGSVKGLICMKDALKILVPPMPRSGLAIGLTSAFGGAALVGAGVAYYRHKTSVKPVSIMVDPLSTDPEGMIPGSIPMKNGREPSCQVRLAFKQGDSYVIVGAGLRVENYLITPTHNCQAGVDLYAVRGTNVVLVDADTEKMLAADVSAFCLTESQWSLLGVKQAKLGPLARDATVMITSSCDYQYSTGILSVGNGRTLGRVEYNASTLPGFSGSGYMNGQVCLGMHCHGGIKPGGYEMLYIYVRLKQAIGQTPESSDDFLLGEASKKSWQVEELSDNAAVVRMSTGHYYLTDTQIVERMRALESRRHTSDNIEDFVNVRWDEDQEYEDLQEQYTRRDIGRTRGPRYEYDPESMVAGFSGEDRAPVVRANPGVRAERPGEVTVPAQRARTGEVQPQRVRTAPPASASSTGSAPQQLTKRQQLMNRLASVSTGQLEGFLLSQGIGRRQRTTMSRPTPAPAPNGAPSASS